jgi:hypothetical protein
MWSPDLYRASRMCSLYAKGELVLDGLGQVTRRDHGEVYRVVPNLEKHGYDVVAYSRQELERL